MIRTKHIHILNQKMIGISHPVTFIKLARISHSNLIIFDQFRVYDKMSLGLRTPKAFGEYLVTDGEHSRLYRLVEKYCYDN